MEAIRYFTGEYRFLSNFYPVAILWDNFVYPSSENAYQAAKSLDEGVREEFRNRSMTPAMAKKKGREIVIRPDWEEIKDEIMLDIIRSKFAHPRLRNMLLGTSTRYLFEGNNWHDTYWGVCDGEHAPNPDRNIPYHKGVLVGENKLGKILEQVRFEAWEQK